MTSQTNWTFSQEFYPKFQASCTDLGERISAAKQTTGATTPILQDTLHRFSTDLSKLTKSLLDATGSLPGYDQKKCEMHLKSLEAILEELRNVSAPKAKFLFKRSAAKRVVPPPSPISALSSFAASPTIPVAQAGSTNLELSTHQGAYLTLDALPTLSTTSHHSDLTISDLDGCMVNLLISHESRTSTNNTPNALDISALHIRNISNSVLILPIIQGSVLLHDIARCVIVVGCHQFRMHTSKHVDVYVHIASTPIIEHSTHIRFSTYPDSLRSSSPPSSTPGPLAVQDFSHIRATPSPNWVMMTDGERTTTWPTSAPVGSESVSDWQETLRMLLPVAQ